MCVTLSSIAITPAGQTVLVNSTQQMVATGTWSDGSTANITSAVAWSTDNSLIATIISGTNGGVASTVGSGTATITATLFGVSGTTTLIVPAQRAFRSTSTQGLSIPGLTPARVTALPIPVADDLGATCYLSFSNQSAAYPNTPNASGVTGTSFWIYNGASTPSGIVKPTGTFFKSFLNQTIPNAGGTLLMGPFDGTGQGKGGFLSVLMGNPTGVQFNVALNIVEGGYLDGTSDGSTIPGLNYNANPVGTMRLLGFQTARKRVVGMGDSQANGYSPGGEVRREQSMFVRLGLDNTWAVDVLGIAGMTLAQAESLTYYHDGEVVDSQVVLVTNLSINSLPVWASLAAAQAEYATFVANRQAEGFQKIILCTLTPSGAYPDGTYGTLRNAVNAWMRAGGISGVSAVCDLDILLRDPADHTQLLAANRLSDSTHFSVVGAAVAAAGLTATISSV